MIVEGRIFDNSGDELRIVTSESKSKIEIHFDGKPNWKSIIDIAFKKMVDEEVAEGFYPRDILIPVEMGDIKNSALSKYTGYIDEAYQRENSRIIGDIFNNGEK